MKTKTIGITTTLIGLATINISLAATELETAIATEEYYVEWVKPDYPPMPPVTVDGIMYPWEAVYGPPPMPELIQVRRPKNPKPPEPYDPEKRWLDIKRRLAPWMTEEQLRAKPDLTELIATAKRSTTLSKESVPKAATRFAEVPSFQSSVDTRSVASSEASMLSGVGGGYETMESGSSSPTLYLAAIDTSEPGITFYELWVLDAPLDNWFEIYAADQLKPHEWYLAHLGEPAFGYGTTLQRYFFAAPGQPSQLFFQVFPFQDSDGDLLTDGMEVAVFKSDPNNADSAFLRDADQNGQPDFSNAGGNWVTDGDEDFDGDGLSNLKEIRMGVDPLIPQDYFTDSDGDYLPDWIEALIITYTTDPNPGLYGDSDGDGVDNYTEVALLTDPSFPDAVYDYNTYYNLPGTQRAFLLPPITVQHTASSDPDSLNDLIYNNSGTLGSFMHLEVRRNRDGNGNPSAGEDTLLFGGAFISPPAMYLDPLPTVTDPSDAFISLSDILATGTSLLGDVWQDAQVSDLIDQLSMEELVVIQQRSMQRTVVRMREIQLAIDLTDSSTGTQMRLRKSISEIHTETVVFRKTSARIAQIQGNNWWTRAGGWIGGAGRVATVFSIGSTAFDVWNAAGPYIFDVRRRCDNYFDTAGDLAFSLGNLASVWAPSFNLFNMWLIYWNQLQEFEGYDSGC